MNKKDNSGLKDLTQHSDDEDHAPCYSGNECSRQFLSAQQPVRYTLPKPFQESISSKSIKTDQYECESIWKFIIGDQTYFLKISNIFMDDIGGVFQSFIPNSKFVKIGKFCLV